MQLAVMKDKQFQGEILCESFNQYMFFFFFSQNTHEIKNNFRKTRNFKEARNVKKMVGFT